MKGWVAAGAALAAGALATRRGLKQLPEPFRIEAATPHFQPQPMPDLPEPVRRYLEVVAPDLPVMTSAIVTGRFTMLMKGLHIPGRWRFTHEVGVGYKHEMELTVFGRKVTQGTETYIDGQARLDLPGQLVENEPKVNLSALQTMWAEYLWLPSVLATARWEASDPLSALMWIPQCEQPFTAVFDQQTGLLQRFDTLRYRDASDAEPVAWTTANLAWTRINGIGVPAVGAVQWADMTQPWLRMSLDDVAWNVDVELP